jgi:hypothetical protein
MGEYFVDYTESEGDCGELEDRIIHAHPERVLHFLPPCSGEVTWTDGNCMTEFVASCPAEEYGPGFYNEQHAVSHFNQDASERVGTYEQTVFRPDGGMYCHSIYEHTAERVSAE